jgi:hypothetical protein
MACGTPVAAHPVTGPIDVVRDRAVGVLSEDLRGAALAALDLDHNVVVRCAQRCSWASATRQFVEICDRRKLPCQCCCRCRTLKRTRRPRRPSGERFERACRRGPDSRTDCSVRRNSIDGVEGKLLDPASLGPPSRCVAFPGGSIRYPNRVVGRPGSIDPIEACTPYIQGEVLMPETKAAEPGLEVLLLPKLFHHLPVTFAADSHCAPSKWQLLYSTRTAGM